MYVNQKLRWFIHYVSPFLGEDFSEVQVKIHAYNTDFVVLC